MAQQTQYRCLTPREIGDAVVMFRRRNGMKQITLASEAGVTERTVQRIEKGEKANDDTLRAIARAFRMKENSFLGPRNVLSDEEALAEAIKVCAQGMLIDAHRFTTLRDAEAVLGPHGMLIDDHFVADDAAAEAAAFKDLLTDWNDVYSDMLSAREKLTAHRSLLGAAQQLEARGYTVRYGVHTTEDDYQVVTILFAREKDEAACEVKQLFVPKSFTEIAINSLQ